ncbi:MAG: transposase [Verrucomicrobiae bacterium]|nr:transposase [Verrucomicrobiae bacterium]
MNPSPTAQKLKHVGLDVHAETIAVAIADPAGEVRSYGNIPAHTHALDKLHKRLTGDGSQARYVYEAGPTGFALCRHLRAQGIACDVVSPSLIPKRASDRVKTDRRDALTLARLLRAGELTSIHVPDEADEAIRDLVRCRLAAVEDLRRSSQTTDLSDGRPAVVTPATLDNQSASPKYATLELRRGPAVRSCALAGQSLLVLAQSTPGRIAASGSIFDNTMAARSATVPETYEFVS